MTDRRLIEDSFPLAAVSASSAKEKNIRHGHISTLHIWWARRPLAAARAAILGCLLPAPRSEEERETFHTLIAESCEWKNLRSPDDAERIRRFLEETTGREDFRVVDPFAGGGAIPLEGLRLGLDVVSNDLNPVAHLLQKCTLDFPQRFGGLSRPQFGAASRVDYPRGESLAQDFEHWARELERRCESKLGEFYSKATSPGCRVAAYYWVRVLECGNPACRGQIPLIKQYWLAKARNLTLVPRFDRAGDFSFEISEPPPGFDPQNGTIKRDKVGCPYCNQVTGAADLKNAGRGGWRQRLIAVYEIPQDSGPRIYRIANESDHSAYELAEEALKSLEESDPELVPNESLPYLRSIFNVHVYGVRRWRELFNARQLLVLSTLVQELRAIGQEMVEEGASPEYSAALTSYLAILIDRVADYNSSVCTWDNSRESIAHTFTRQALGMVWDYAESDPLAGGSGSLRSSIDWIGRVIRHAGAIPKSAVVLRGSATKITEGAIGGKVDLVVTDPPYYDAVPYADLSDFFYVWAKRSLAGVFPDLFATALTPKRDEAVQLAERNEEYAYKTKERFEELLTESFQAARLVLREDGVIAVMFAHKSTAAWETLLSSLLRAGLVVTASWPLDTEMGSRLRTQNSAALASSVLIICRIRHSESEGFFDEVEPELEARLRERLDYFWSQGIRGADFFMSAIGPAVEVFGRHSQVLKLSGEVVPIGELLIRVRAIVADYALQRIVRGERTGDVDDASRFYVIWRWAFGAADVEAGEAIHMAQSMGCEFDALVADKGVLHKKGDKVVLKGPNDRRMVKGLGEPAATGMVAPLIDVLHRAAIIWAAGDRQELADFLAAALPPGGVDRMQRLGQSIVDVLVPGDKERALYENFLVGARSLPSPTKKDEMDTTQQELF